MAAMEAAPLGATVHEQNFDRTAELADKYAQDTKTLTGIEIISLPIAFGNPMEYDEPALIVAATRSATYSLYDTYRETVATAKFGYTRSHFINSVLGAGTEWDETVFVRGSVEYKSVSELREGRAVRSAVLTREHDPQGMIKRSDAGLDAPSSDVKSIPGLPRVASMLEKVKAAKAVHSIVELSRSQSRADFAAITALLKHAGIGSVALANEVFPDIRSGRFRYVEYAEINQRRYMDEGPTFPDMDIPEDFRTQPHVDISVVDETGNEIHEQTRSSQGQKLMQLHGPEALEGLLDALEVELGARTPDTAHLVNTPLTRQHIGRLLCEFDLLEAPHSV